MYSVRFVHDSEKCLVEELWDYSFDKKETAFFQWYFSQFFKCEYSLGVFAGNDLAAMSQLHPIRFLLNGKVIDSTYIVGVATSPVHRGKGLLRKLLSESFKAVRNKGQSLLILMPSAAGVYLPYGFSYCYNQLLYNLPIVDLAYNLPKVKGFDFQFLGKGDIAIVQKLYENFTHRLNGVCVRNWESFLIGHFAEGSKVVACKQGDEFLGYMLYVIENDEFHIYELASTCDDVKLALLNFASQHFSQCSTVEWHATADDLTYLRFKKNAGHPTVRPFMMGRILDPIGALKELNFLMVDGCINIEITDSIVVENNGVFRLHGKDGKATLEKTDAKADIVLDIGVLAQLYFGMYSVDDLFNAGYLKGATKEHLVILDTVFKVKINFINEYV